MATRPAWQDGRMRDLAAELAGLVAGCPAEAADLDRLRGLAAGTDPWSRSAAVHVTASAVVVHPPTRRVLLRWHARMGSWLFVGGHADPGETAPLRIALREAAEETGLPDLAGWPEATDPVPIHVVVVPVPAGRGEPAHEHADIRYVLATEQPDTATPESPAARLRWHRLPAALSTVTEANLRLTLRRIQPLLG
jgi:8-oxo-dGTP pyrophosphatase MutT (NUDIX family)